MTDHLTAYGPYTPINLTSGTHARSTAMIYLTNITPFDGIAEVVSEAARLSGQPVQYQPRPMPEWAFKYPPGYTPPSTLGSIVVNRSELGDLSEFWRHYRELRNQRDIC